MRQNLLIAFIIVFIIAVSVFSVVQFPLNSVVSYIAENRLSGAFLFALLMFVATVVAPLTMLPVVPLVAPFLGPFTTGVAATVGWLLGAVVAFYIARYGGRPFLARFVNMRALERFESRIPKETHFVVLVMLRMLFPVDILSYALGLFSSVSVPKYIITTFLGIIWFSFAFAYLGDAIYSRDYVLLSSIGVASASVLIIATAYVRKHHRKRQ